MKTYLNTPAIYSQPLSKVDSENGIISNIVVTAIGEAKGHNIHLNSSFLDDVVMLASKRPSGIKARFGHPNICATALGTYLGRYKNYRREGDKVLADLHLDKSAINSPNGNLYTYVLDMAENNPDMFGASIAFKQGEQTKELSEVDGKQVEKTFATIKALYATDLVDSPAATDGLFEAFHQDDFASQVTMFLDNHPQVYDLLDSKPHILQEFLINYKHHKSTQKMNLSDEITKLKNWITDNFAQLPEGLSEEHQAIFDTLRSEFESKLSAFSDSDTQLSELNDKITLLTDERDTVVQTNTELVTIQTELQTQVDTLTSEVNQLKATKTGKPIGADPNVSLNKKNQPEKNDVLNHMPKQLRTQLNKK